MRTASNMRGEKTVKRLGVAMSLLTLLGFAQAQTPTFHDNFQAGKLDADKWIVAQWKSADTKPGINAGLYVPETIDLSQGVLRIGVVQKQVAVGEVQSFGGAIQSKEKFGFGTYEFVIRQTSDSPTFDGKGSVKTGGVSSGFIYNKNSESEIDVEFLGDRNSVWMTNWHNKTPQTPPTSDCKHTEEVRRGDLYKGFHDYKVIWTSKRVDWYIDGKLVASHKDHVPQEPAHIILQHRGTNSDKWGGVASVNVTRYAYFKSVTFTPEAK